MGCFLYWRWVREGTTLFHWLQPKQQAILGVDISSGSVKILQITHAGGQYTVEGYGCASFPKHAIESNIIHDPDVVANCIKKILLDTHISCRQAALAVPDSLAISKVIQTNPGLKESEIEELVFMEADKYPYPIDEVNLDFNVLGPSSKNAALQDVLMVASRSEIVNSRIAAVARAGLSVKIVDLESYAVERATQLLTTMLPAAGVNKILAIIDIGETYTHFFVFYNLKIIFTREEEFGGKQLIDAMVTKYGMKADEARLALDEDRLPLDEVTDVLQTFRESILLQVKRGLQLFFSTTHYTYVDNILLAGGVAKQSGIAELLQEHINIATSTIQLFKQVAVAKTVDKEQLFRDSPKLMVACGLALRTDL